MDFKYVFMIIVLTALANGTQGGRLPGGRVQRVASSNQTLLNAIFKSLGEIAKSEKQMTKELGNLSKIAKSEEKMTKKLGNLGEIAKSVKQMTRELGNLGEIAKSEEKMEKDLRKIGDGLIIGGIPIRLVGGSRPWEGRVEVFYDEKWGSICDNSFDEEDAKVVCRQLGYEGGTTEGDVGDDYDKHEFGPGDKVDPDAIIWIDKVQCSGSEAGLRDCPIKWNTEGIECAHIADVGVKCKAPTTTAAPQASTPPASTPPEMSSSATARPVTMSPVTAPPVTAPSATMIPTTVQ